MKNVSLAIAAALIAFLIYFFAFHQTPTPTAAPQDTTPSQTETTAAPSNLITPAAPGADVFIISPGDGAVVSSPVKVEFGITNMTVAKAGDNIEFSGHHHLLINLEELPPMDAPLPATEQIIHFGGGQTETTLELEPGEYTLQLLLGNYLHIPHAEPVLSKKITITVE
ncbi:hypothetical protein GCM10008090_13720 [Arenicella chitinivorans]|uniref:DUF4399 domain-containing protein n=1 Tax=Arenicella chitinivorans TaxID=1329800 RepID=A0A918RPB7_9GAMM|nr:DUF4399 domain-containing protein [Arenicella chitinivorans]GHA05393.1 hypothetical protein GCM10008090_13720 [Arenicella chitinivorans]